ncbi:hypothetical protein, partial [Bacteroides caccae]|uniref:hypothetical protein n=1 Tax=Bacteroides caccae TaxID=47678 RepID=UPI0034A1322F
LTPKRPDNFSTMILQIGNPTPLFKLITLVKPIKYRFYSLLPELLFYQFFEFSMTYFVFRE